jgi:hypothetical protein
VAFVDVEIQDGWQDDIEASAGWQSSVIPLSEGATTDASGGSDESRGLGAFAGDESDDADSGGESQSTSASANGDGPADGEEVEFTGVVVQAADPVILDDGEETMSVETDADVTLGQEVTVRGAVRDGRLRAEELR